MPIFVLYGKVSRAHESIECVEWEGDLSVSDGCKVSCRDGTAARLALYLSSHGQPVTPSSTNLTNFNSP